MNLWNYIRRMDAADLLIMVMEGLIFLAFLAGVCSALILAAAAMGKL